MKYRIEAGKRCFSDVPGAVFVSWDTNTSSDIEVRPATFGLFKENGCVVFYPGKYVKYCIQVNIKQCDQIYYDHPKREEAWLVLPDGTGYEWIRIDDQIEFS